MKKIPSFVHGVIDYATGVTLLLAPTLFGFENLGGAAVMIPRAIGILILGQSLLTDYELGAMKIIPLNMHLMMDYVAAALLALSPFLFGFADEDAHVWMPHLLVGVTYFVVTLMTKTKAQNASGRPSLA